MTPTWGGPQPASPGPPPDHHDPDEHDPDRARLVALVDLARDGDAEAFGQLYDHHVTKVYRYVAARVGSRPLAEDLTSETFTRALRSIATFRWQHTDFGAWLTTIARNLITDHYRSCRHRLEVVATELPDSQLPDNPSTDQDSPEDAVLASLRRELLVTAFGELPEEQQDCLRMRFVHQLSIAQTAHQLDRSPGAVKQLQLRAIRRLARSLPTDPDH
ncbi:MAG: sigma-70 family RNA polymerase sigma factor [Pseudonocardiaceae bacterium]